MVKFYFGFTRFLTTSISARITRISLHFLRILQMAAYKVAIGIDGRMNVRRTKTQRAIVVQGAPTMNIFARFVNDESGATAIEYGLIASCIAVAIIVVVQGVGTKLNSTFTSVSNAL